MTEKEIQELQEDNKLYRQSIVKLTNKIEKQNEFIETINSNYLSCLSVRTSRNPLHNSSDGVEVFIDEYIQIYYDGCVMQEWNFTKLRNLLVDEVEISLKTNPSRWSLKEDIRTTTLFKNTNTIAEIIKLYEEFCEENQNAWKIHFGKIYIK